MEVFTLLTDRINKYYNQLNETDLHILKVIMSDTKSVEDMSIEVLAKKCTTSRTSILRFCKKIGFSGYSEFKSFLKWESQSKTSINDPIDARKFIQTDFEATYFQLNDTNQIDEVVKKIKESNRVFVYGTGQAQQYCAREFQRLFMQIDKYIYVMMATEEFKLGTHHLDSSDLVIIISLSGNVDSIQDQLRILQSKGVPIASITNLESNPLASMSTYRLYAVSSPVDIHQNLVHNSFINFFVVVEYIFESYIKQYLH